EQHAICTNLTLEEDVIIDTPQPDLLALRAYTNISTSLAIAALPKEIKPWTELVPAYLHDYEDIFTKEEFDQLPPRHEWDHAIDLIPGALAEEKIRRDLKSKDLPLLNKQKYRGKVYDLNGLQMIELDKFIQDNL